MPRKRNIVEAQLAQSCAVASDGGHVEIDPCIPPPNGKVLKCRSERFPHRYHPPTSSTNVQIQALEALSELRNGGEIVLPEHRPANFQGLQISGLRRQDFRKIELAADVPQRKRKVLQVWALGLECARPTGRAHGPLDSDLRQRIAKRRDKSRKFGSAVTARADDANAGSFALVVLIATDGAEKVTRATGEHGFRLD